MLKSFKYRLYPNKEQEIQIQKTFGCCRFVYNQTLAHRKELYETEKKSMSKFECSTYCTQICNNQKFSVSEFPVPCQDKGDI